MILRNVTTLLALMTALLSTPGLADGQQDSGKSKVAAAPREQDPAVVNPTSITVRIENDSVRVMEAVLPPGFKETVHTHPGYVMYIVEGGTVRLHMADGRTRDSAFKAGDVFYSDPITHWAENTGTTTIRVMIVELRRR
jgi:quercetin dioxygenase-like cupin family protein